MTDMHLEEIKSALQNSDYALAAVKAQEHLEKLNNVPVTIAITGESGSGKSTLVNALRGIKNKTPGAAPTGVVETTEEPTEYIHPQNNNIRIWDLPGIGTPNFKADEYLKKIGFEKFDFFIIVSSERFRENDAKLATEIQKMKKKFYFVRSKIDSTIKNEIKDDPNMKEMDLLDSIRKNCTKELQKLLEKEQEGCTTPPIFLVSGFELDRYEFKNLWEKLKEELPEHQRDVLLLALPNISLEIINQKKQALEAKIKWYVIASAAGAAVPVPGLSGMVDLSLLVKFAVQCQISFRVTAESLQTLSDVCDVPLEELLAELKSPLAAVKITSGIMLRVLTTSVVYITATVIEEGARFIPFVGTAFSMTISSITTYKSLKYILKTLAEDSQRVFTKALKLDTSL